MLTDLDKALIKAIDDPKNYESAYYDLFLNSEILVPVWETSIEEGESVATGDEAISPVILDVDQKQCIPIFDTEERLAEWAQDQQIRFVGMDGFSLLKTFQTDFYLMLNVNSENMKEFSPEEIEWLLLNLSPEANDNE